MATTKKQIAEWYDEFMNHDVQIDYHEQKSYEFLEKLKKAGIEDPYDPPEWLEDMI